MKMKARLMNRAIGQTISRPDSEILKKSIGLPSKLKETFNSTGVFQLLFTRKLRSD